MCPLQALVVSLQGPSTQVKPKAYQVPSDFDKAVLGEVDVSSLDAAELGLANAFWLRWLDLRKEARFWQPAHSCLFQLCLFRLYLLLLCISLKQTAHLLLDSMWLLLAVLPDCRMHGSASNIRLPLYVAQHPSCLPPANHYKRTVSLEGCAWA